MERTIDDLPLVLVSTLVANGRIKRRCDRDAASGSPTTGVEYRVGVRVRIFKNPYAGFPGAIQMPEMRRQRTAASFARRQACLRRGCVRASGLIYHSAGDAHRKSLCSDGSSTHR